MIGTPARDRSPLTSFAGAGALAWAVILVLAALVAALAVVVLGPFALGLLAATVALIAVVVAPRGTALALLAFSIVIEPGAIDYTAPLSLAWYAFPPEIAARLPLTVSPMEVMIVLIAASLALRPAPRGASWERVPWVAWSVPAFMAFGLAWGLYQGAPANLAYHEMRGLIFGGLVFFIALRMRDVAPATLVRVTLASTAVLGVIMIIRYVFYAQAGRLAIPLEFAFAHENVLFLGIGAVLSGLLLVRQGGSLGYRLVLLAHLLLVVAGTLATARRSGTLVLLAAAAILLWLVFPKRPMLAALAAVLALTFGSLYLTLYWDHGTGALGQPARAIRSQIDPGDRDLSSDLYRERERFNVDHTIRSSPITGIGFGNPFEMVQPLPDLTSFWPMQQHVAHDNVLWLWLKMGAGGIVAVLAVWLAALSRMVRLARMTPREVPLPVLPMAVAATLFMYAAFARVDIVLVESRAIAPLAIALAIALTYRGQPPEDGAPAVDAKRPAALAAPVALPRARPSRHDRGPAPVAYETDPSFPTGLGGTGGGTGAATARRRRRRGRPSRHR